jgi:hypothetical protein
MSFFMVGLLESCLTCYPYPKYRQISAGAVAPRARTRVPPPYGKYYPYSDIWLNERIYYSFISFITFISFISLWRFKPLKKRFRNVLKTFFNAFTPEIDGRTAEVHRLNL